MNILRSIVWIFIFANCLLFIGLFTVKGSWILGVQIVIFVLIQSWLSEESWVHTFWERVGTGVMGGIVVSIFRDFTLGTANPKTVIFYVGGFIVAFVLILMGLIGQEKGIPKKIVDPGAF